MPKTRLDVLLVERGLVPTRAKAQALILAGQITIDGVPYTKAGHLVELSSDIGLLSQQKYVSRGGEKLEGALSDFQISVDSQICMDVGSSTGGFTDCLLQQGALKVYAIDVGTAQMDSQLKTNPKIVLREQTHILNVDASQLQPLPTLVTIDVSFISLKKVLPKVKELLAESAVVLAMVKPQFEVGLKFLRKGVVRSEAHQNEAVESVKVFSESLGFQCLGQTPAKIKGPKGNQEYFLYLRR